MKLHTLFLFISVTAIFLLWNSFTFKTPKVISSCSDSITTIHLVFTGDLMCHSPQFQYAKTGVDSFNFNTVYSYTAGLLSNADFTFGNLETVTAGKKAGYSGYPLFNSPDAFVNALKNAGFDFLFTSNNHALDKGIKGVTRTIDILDKNHLMHTGTFVSEKDRDSIRIINLKGINIAVLSYSYGVNGNLIPKGKEYSINLIDTVLIKKDIMRAKEKSPDLILVYFHFGSEYERTPSKQQVEIVNKTVSYGADIIIGSHPHVIQSYSVLKGYHNLDSVFVAYSLGNFISNQRRRYTDAGLILNLNVTKNFTKDSVFISDYSFIPTWVYKGETGQGNEFFILPSESAFSDSLPSFITPSDISKMKQAYFDTESLLNTKTKYFSTKRHLLNKDSLYISE